MFVLRVGREGLDVPPICASAVPSAAADEEKGFTDIQVELSAPSSALEPPSALERAVSGDHKAPTSSSSALSAFDEGAPLRSRSASKDLWDSDDEFAAGDEGQASSGNADLQRSVSVTETKDSFLPSTSIICKQSLERWDNEVEYWQKKLEVLVFFLLVHAFCIFDFLNL